MWIPWNFQWIYIVNSCTIPYGFHVRIHIKFHGKTTNCVVKNSVNIKNRTVDSTTHHVHGRKCALTAEPYNCYKTTHCPSLIVLWVGHAQSERRQMPMLDLGAINNPQHSFSTTTIIQEARPTTPTTQHHPTVTTLNVVTMHSKSSPSSFFTDTHPRCHIAVSDVATRWRMADSNPSLVIVWLPGQRWQPPEQQHTPQNEHEWMPTCTETAATTTKTTSAP